MKRGWLVNDCLTCIPGTKTFWHDLLLWLPGLEDKTGGYTDYSVLPNRIESNLRIKRPDYIIRNATYFRRLHTNVKTISLVQDVIQSGGGLQNQIDVINHSAVAVFNTSYVYQKYKNYISSGVPVKICPLGVNFDFFRPTDERHPDVLPNSVVFIGASTDYPKGFNVMRNIIESMSEQNFCLVMKDDFSLEKLPEAVRHRVRIFNRVNQETVRQIINSCICAVCTSYEETQHLSGIECAACNIPIVAREVGVYYDNRDDPRWGRLANDANFADMLLYVISNLDKFSPRECFIDKYSTDTCRKNWVDIIAVL